MMTDGDAEVLFKGVTKALRTTGVTIGMTQLIDEVFYAVHALVIERMRHQLARSG